LRLFFSRWLYGMLLIQEYNYINKSIRQALLSLVNNDLIIINKIAKNRRYIYAGCRKGMLRKMREDFSIIAQFYNNGLKIISPT